MTVSMSQHNAELHIHILSTSHLALPLLVGTWASLPWRQKIGHGLCCWAGCSTCKWPCCSLWLGRGKGPQSVHVAALYIGLSPSLRHRWIDIVTGIVLVHPSEQLGLRDDGWPGVEGLLRVSDYQRRRVMRHMKAVRPVQSPSDPQKEHTAVRSASTSQVHEWLPCRSCAGVRPCFD